MMELILLPLGAATGWLIGRNANTDTRTAMLALVIAGLTSHILGTPCLEVLLGSFGLATGSLASNRLH